MNAVWVRRRFSFFCESEGILGIENVLPYFAVCRTTGTGFIVSNDLRLI